MTALPPPWRSTPTLLFAGMMLALATVGVSSLLVRGPSVTGLPDDPGVREARVLLGARLPVASGELRFRCALIGDGREEPPGSDFRRELSIEEATRVAVAETLLAQARIRHPKDPRLICALAHLDLAAQRFERAERRYRGAIRRAPRYGEARLGSGLALAMTANTLGDESQVRRLRLEAIAQFAAVGEEDPQYLPALYNRTLLLHQVGRREEARRRARRYVELDAGSVWSEAIARIVGVSVGG